MIKLSDASLLAFTKLRTKKIRTGLTIFLASLLFGLAGAASLILSGAFASIDSFRQDGLTSRYIVSVFSAPPPTNSLHNLRRDPVLLEKAKVQYEQLVAKKTAEAKRLGIPYSQASDQPPWSEELDGTGAVLGIRDRNGIVQALLAEKFSTEPTFDDAKLAKLAHDYQATNTFTAPYYTATSGSSLNTFTNGKEVFYDQSNEEETNTNYVRPLIDGMFTISPPEITAPFMLPHNAGWQPSDDTLPIILPQNTIEQLLELKKLPNDATAAQKLERLKTVQKRASSLTFQACYRNSASIALIQDTIHQQKDTKAHAGDKDYTSPARTYTLPDPTTCENPVVASDTRSAAEKKRDDNQKIFDQEFNDKEDPVSYFVPFKVVGMSPLEDSFNPNAPPSQQSRDLSDIVSSLLKATGVGQTIPKALYDQLPDASKYADLFTYTPSYMFGNTDNLTRYVEFQNAHDAEKFIREQSCTIQYDNSCQPADHPYQAFLSFSNSVAIEDIRTKAAELFTYVVIGVAALAAIIMWIAIGRTIADGRHETAIFRAIGFKRSDISAVYLLYTVALVVLVAFFAGIISYASAYVVNVKLAPTLTAQAQYGFGSLDVSKEVSLIGFDWHQLGLLLIVCLATGLLSAVIPLLRNVRRSPIRDMREE